MRDLKEICVRVKFKQIPLTKVEHQKSPFSVKFAGFSARRSLFFGIIINFSHYLLKLIMLII